VKTQRKPVSFNELRSNASCLLTRIAENEQKEEEGEEWGRTERWPRRGSKYGASYPVWFQWDGEPGRNRTFNLWIG